MSNESDLVSEYFGGPGYVDEDEAEAIEAEQAAESLQDQPVTWSDLEQLAALEDEGLSEEFEGDESYDPFAGFTDEEIAGMAREEFANAIPQLDPVREAELTEFDNQRLQAQQLSRADAADVGAAVVDQLVSEGADRHDIHSPESLTILRENVSKEAWQIAQAAFAEGYSADQIEEEMPAVVYDLIEKHAPAVLNSAIAYDVTNRVFGAPRLDRSKPMPANFARPGSWARVTGRVR